MPIARFQMPDGRVARFEVPEGYSPEQAQAEFELFIKQQEPNPSQKVARDAFKPYDASSPATAIVEPLLSMATGTYATAKGGLKGLGALFSGEGLDKAVDVIKKTQEESTYQPRTKVGQAVTGVIGDVMHKALVDLPGSAGEYIAGNEGRLAGEVLPTAALTALGYKPMVRGATAAKDFAVSSGRQMAQGFAESAQSGATKLMVNALKPTPSQHISGEATLAAQELLKRNLSPNTQGLAAIEARIAELQNEIRSGIGSSQALISKQKVIDRLEAVKDRFAKTANPEADLAAIESAGAEFGRHPLIPGEGIPIQLAQDIKKGTYSELRNKYGELGTATTEAQKALARGLKEEIASAVPEVAALNAEEAALFKTLNVAERRAFLELNKDPVPLTGALRSPEAWVAMTADKSSAFKALLARMIYKLGSAAKSVGKPAVLPAPTLTLAPLGTPLSTQSASVSPPKGRGLLSIADDQSHGATGLQMPSVDMPIQGRLSALYERGGIQRQEGGIGLEPRLDMPIVNLSGGQAPSTRGMLSLADESTPIPDTNRLATRHDVPTMEFQLKLEMVNSNPVVQSLLKQATSAINPAVRAKAQKELLQYGIRSLDEAKMLQGLYETKGNPRLQIEKVRGLE